MPTYEYACTDGHRFEVVQSFSDEPLTTCTTCGKPVKRVFHPVGIVLKGSGFYSTDNRSGKSLSPKKDDSSGGSSSSSTTTEKKTETKTEKKADKKSGSA